MTNKPSTIHIPIGTATASILGSRTLNNDRVFATTDTVVIVDGAGEHVSASNAAAAALGGALFALARTAPGDPGRAEGTVRSASDAVIGLDGAGSTTITVVTLSGGAHITAHLAWLGDSPAFLLRQGRIQQLTRPHNRAQEAAERHFIPYDHIQDSPLANQLTRGLGAIADGPAELLAVALQPGDRVLAASDGIFAIPLANLGWALSQGDDSHTAAAAVITAAADHGTRDNTSVAVIVIDAPRTSATGTISLELAGTADSPEDIPRWKPPATATGRAGLFSRTPRRDNSATDRKTGPLLGL